MKDVMQKTFVRSSEAVEKNVAFLKEQGLIRRIGLSEGKRRGVVANKDQK